VLGAFARRIIYHQPLDYLAAVGKDVLRFFTPGATAYGDAGSATSLPGSAAQEVILPDVRRRFVPGLRPRARSPSALLRDYRRVLHVPRPLLALLALASLAGLALRVRARRELLLLSGSGLMLILGSAATAGFGLRYLLPSVPLIATGGGLAARDLWDLSPAARKAEAAILPPLAGEATGSRPRAAPRA
jgi:hypothetical protein